MAGHGRPDPAGRGHGGEEVRNPFEIEELLKRRTVKATVVELKPARYVPLAEQRSQSQNFGWLDDTVPDDYHYPEEDSTDPAGEAL